MWAAGWPRIQFWLAGREILAGWLLENSGWLAAAAAARCLRPPLPLSLSSPPPLPLGAGSSCFFMANSRQSHYRRGRKKKELRRLRKLTRGQLYDLECRRVHRQRGRDLKEFLWQVHSDRLSGRDRGRFERREARRRQHGALNYTERREARREARRRGQNGISALADADAALADVALAEAGATSATMQDDPLATLLSSPPFRKLACAESALTAAAAAATADMIASDDADVALAGAALATAAAQATTAALRAVREEHAMNELIEKEGSSWRVDPGAAPGPALSPAPPWVSRRRDTSWVSRRRAARIAIWDSDL